MLTGTVRNYVRWRELLIFGLCSSSTTYRLFTHDNEDCQG